MFLFIGDGMSYPQIQATAYFNGAQQSGEEPTIERVSFMDFPVIGSQYTYDEAARVMAGGKIDWACHANDCAAAIHDVMTLEDCVAEAVAFYEGHPDETLIVVTGDHETGGLTIGYAAIATRAK